MLLRKKVGIGLIALLALPSQIDLTYIGGMNEWIETARAIIAVIGYAIVIAWCLFSDDEMKHE